MSTPTDAGDLAAWLDTHRDELVAFRRAMHAHPELSGVEHATTESIAERLRVAGLSSRVFASGTGVVCDLGAPPFVALRADIDALAMADEKDVSYRSQIPGVAHACGHDVHTTVVLGAGLYLARHHPATGVRLLFQPAEEQLPGGARGVIDDGGLDDVTAILGVHCDPKLDVGAIGLRPGPLTSAADLAIITLHGSGGHTARPEETVDMIAVVGSIIEYLPRLVRNHFPAEAPLKIVFGAVRSGDAGNVIPSRAELRVSIRTPSVEIWEQLPAIIEQTVNELAARGGADAELDYVVGVPPVDNDPAIIEAVRASALEVLGASAITEAVQSWGGDDFAWYLRQVPGAYVRLGTHDPAAQGPPLDLHAGRFDVHEDAIGVGVRLLVAAVTAVATQARTVG